MSYCLDNMKTQRELAGLDISAMARAANVSDVTIKRLEDGGHEDNAIAQRIADALGISLETLGGREL